MPHLHFTLKISLDLFDSLELLLSAQPSFENLLEFELGFTAERFRFPRDAGKIDNT